MIGAQVRFGWAEAGETFAELLADREAIDGEFVASRLGLPEWHEGEVASLCASCEVATPLPRGGGARPTRLICEGRQSARQQLAAAAREARGSCGVTRQDIGFYNGWSPDERRATLPIQKAAIASGQLARPTTCSICMCEGSRDWRAEDAVWHMTRITLIRLLLMLSAGDATAPCIVALTTRSHGYRSSRLTREAALGSKL